MIMPLLFSAVVKYRSFQRVIHFFQSYFSSLLPFSSTPPFFLYYPHTITLTPHTLPFSHHTLPYPHYHSPTTHSPTLTSHTTSLIPYTLPHSHHTHYHSHTTHTTSLTPYTPLHYHSSLQSRWSRPGLGGAGSAVRTHVLLA